MKKFSQIILVAIVLIIVSIGYFYQTRPSAGARASNAKEYTGVLGLVQQFAKGAANTIDPGSVPEPEKAPESKTEQPTVAQTTPSASTVAGIPLPSIADLNPLKADSLFDLVAIQIPKFLFSIVAALAMLFFTLSAARMLFGASSPDEATKAKQGMTWAIIGLVLAAGSYAILRFIENAIKGA